MRLFLCPLKDQKGVSTQQVAQGMFCDETRLKNQDNPECVPSLHAQVDSVNVTAEKVAARCVRSCIIYD